MKEKFERYLKRKGLSDKTIKDYMFYFNKIDAENINQEIVNEFIDRYNNSVSRAFIINLTTFLKKRNITLPKKTGTKSKKIPIFISREQVNKIIDAMDSLKKKLMVAITFQGGLRLGELMNVKPNDFNWEEWKKNPGESGKLLITGKGSRERIVFLSSDLMQLIYKYVKGLEYDIEITDNIWPNVGVSCWQISLRKASLKAIGKKISPHVLRHSCATYLHNEKGWNLMEIKEYLGHQDVSTTQIYTHIDKKKLREKFESSF